MRTAYKIFRRIEGDLRPLAYPWLPRKYAVVYRPGRWISAPGKSRFFLFDSLGWASMIFSGWSLFDRSVELWEVAYTGKSMPAHLVAIICPRGFSPVSCGRRFATFWRLFPVRSYDRLFKALPEQVDYSPPGTITAKRIKPLKLLKKGGQRHERTCV